MTTTNTKSKLQLKWLFRTQKGNQVLFISGLALAILCIILFQGLVHGLASAGYGCVIRDNFGFKCVSCGGTRSVSKLISGDLITAFRYNAFIVILLFIVFAIYIAFGVNAFRTNYKPFSIKYRNIYLTLFIALAFVFTIIRNMAFYEMYLY